MNECIIDIRGKKICYTDVGNGPIIVFLHGWMDSKKVYADVIEILSKKYRCISIDLPGFGHSETIENIKVTEMSALIHRLVKKLKIKEFNLVGHSLGGGVSIVYGKNHQDKINKMVLISPFVSYKQFSRITFYMIRYLIPNFIKTRASSILFKFMTLVNHIFYHKSLSYEYLKHIESEDDAQKAINAFNIAYELSSLDLYKTLKKIRKDILIVYGAKDSLLSIKPLIPFFDVVNNIRLAIFQDVRHFLYTYNNNDLAAKIDEFLKASGQANSNHLK